MSKKFGDKLIKVKTDTDSKILTTESADPAIEALEQLKQEYSGE